MSEQLAPEKPKAPDLLERAYSRQLEFEEETTEACRKAKGQFFTPPSIARFMARQFKRVPSKFALLDPGAGTGALTLAVCERLLVSRTPKSLNVHLFETDKEVLPILLSNMKDAQDALKRAGHSFEYVVDSRDFLLDIAASNPTLFADSSIGPFDAVITNPPYFKINKSSDYARALSEIVHGQPNIYTLFMAQSCLLVREGGEFVAITPRSFCNGLYFREFRKWFFDRMSLENVHLFGSRSSMFREAKVLQENIITRFRKLKSQSSTVSVSRTRSRDFSEIEVQELPSEQVIDDTCGESLIYVPEVSEDAEVVRYAESWPHRFADLGLKISTGPVVMFRAKEFLLDEPNGTSVPLLSAHNVKPFTMNWPVEKKKWPLAFKSNRASRKHLTATGNYVLVKRFSAKEERRRLTAGCIFTDSVDTDFVALENHLNFIYHGDRELSRHETLGIAALFNSVVFDRYFRCFSGNTQVNATEVRIMKFPELDAIAEIGRRVSELEDTNRSETETIVLDELQINGELRTYVLGLVN